MKKVMYVFVSCIIFVVMFYCTSLVITAKDYETFETGEIVKTGETFNLKSKAFDILYMTSDGIPIEVNSYSSSTNSNVPVDFAVIGEHCGSNTSTAKCSRKFVNDYQNVSLEGIKEWRFLGLTRPEDNSYVGDLFLSSSGPLAVFREYVETSVDFEIDKESIKPDEEVVVDVVVDTKDIVKNIEFSINDEYFDVVDVEYKDNWNNYSNSDEYVLSPKVEKKELFGKYDVATLKLKNIKEVSAKDADVDVIKDIKYKTYYNQFMKYDCPSGLIVESLDNKCVLYTNISPFCYYSGISVPEKTVGFYSSGYYVSGYVSSGTRYIVKSYNKPTVASGGGYVTDYYDGGYVNGRYFDSGYYVDGCEFDSATDSTELGYDNGLVTYEAVYTKETIKITNELYVEETPKVEEPPKAEETPKEETPKVDPNPETVDGILPLFIATVLLAVIIVICNRMKRLSE